jgi:SAM-dependent MidA family methyltransferase
MALGLGDRLNALSSGQFAVPELLKRRDALHQLIDPAGLGKFRVLLQGKGAAATHSAPCRGFQIPPGF